MGQPSDPGSDPAERRWKIWICPRKGCGYFATRPGRHAHPPFNGKEVDELVPVEVSEANFVTHAPGVTRSRAVEVVPAGGLVAELEAERGGMSYDDLYARTVNPRRNTGRALRAIAEERWADAVDLLADAHDDLQQIGRDQPHNDGGLLTCGEADGEVVAAARLAAERSAVPTNDEAPT
jgi:hypothetical protein